MRCRHSHTVLSFYCYIHKMTLFGNKIIVGGGGIGGLTFVVALDKYCRDAKVPFPEVAILERVSDRSKKMKDTYSLSIRGDTGAIDCIKELGLLDALDNLRSVTDYPALTGFILSTSSKGQPLDIVAELLKTNDSTRRAPRCDLWAMLLDRALAIKGVEMHWGFDIVAVENAQTGPVVVRAADGRSFAGDLLIACDGNGSAIRSVLAPNEKPTFQKAVIVALFAELGKLPPLIATRYGIVAGDNGSALFICPERHGTMLIAHSQAVADESEANKITSDPNLLQTTINRIKSDFGSPFSDIIANGIKPDCEVRTVLTYDKAAHSSVHRAIFIGDSTHPVTPFSGNGAGMAIIDASSLAKLLVSSKLPLADTVRQFDAEVKQRAQRSIDDGRRVIGAIHATDRWTILQRNTIWRTLGFVLNHKTLVVGTFVALLAVGVGTVVKRFWWH